MNTERKPIIVGLGEILWDLLPEGRQLGGAPANFAYHCHALGGKGLVVLRQLTLARSKNFLPAP